MGDPKHSRTEQPSPLAVAIGKVMKDVRPPTRSEKKVIDLVQHIQQVNAKEDDAIGFSHVYVQTMIPHNDTENGESWFRTNGRFDLIIQSGEAMRDGKPRKIGVPYGNIPKLLLIWIATEVVKSRHHELYMGDSLRQFMDKIGMGTATGGRWGSITRLKDQMRRLFNAQIRYEWREGDDQQGAEEVQFMKVARKYKMMWDTKSPYQTGLFESLIILDRDFFEEVLEHAVPFDLRVVSAIKQSPLALDLYTWLTYRMSRLRKTTYISWESLSKEFGADYKHHRDFGVAARRELTKILQLYREARVEFVRGRMILRPSKPHVKRLLK